jgi:phenol hydroxylase P0 protein
MAPEDILDDYRPPMDATRRFVRLRGERGNGFVEFEFAIGEPELFVELILNRESFEEFCATNKVEVLSPLAAHSSEDGERSEWDWRLADATKTRFK